MEYGGYFVYIAFMLLLVFWGRKIGGGQLPFLTKLLIIFALFVFFALGGERWQEIWILLWPQWALVVGFFLGAFPRWFAAIPRPSGNRRRMERQHRETQTEIDRQKRAAEDDLRRQEREASERFKQEQRYAEENLRRETERVKREANERVRQAKARAREQANRHRQQTHREKAQSQPDPYEILGIKRGATKAEIKSAYRTMAAKYHPDKAPNATDEIKKLAEEKFKEIQTSYQELYQG